MTTPLFKIPKPIVENMEKLNALVEEYPVSIPLAEAAKLMVCVLPSIVVPLNRDIPGEKRKL